MPKEPKDKPTPEELQAEAIAKAGDGAAVIIGPDGAIRTQDLKIRKYEKHKGGKLNTKQPRPKASKEMADAYRWAATQATHRADHVEPWDRKEAKQWRKVATYCRMMAGGQYVNPPESKVDYNPHEIPMDPDEIRVRIAQEILEGKDEPATRWLTAEKKMAVAGALAILSPTERVVVRMVIAWRLPKGFAAEVLGMKPKSVEQILSHARKKWGMLRVEG